MRVISLNVNGVRAAASKGLFSWVIEQQADIVCLQEIKVMSEQLDATFHPAGYHTYFYSAQKKGYSGVGIYSRYRPQSVQYGLGMEDMDKEGRYIELTFPECKIASIYMPSGASKEERQQVKFSFIERYYSLLGEAVNASIPFIIAGDWNIAHTILDLTNWKANLYTPGFTPHERAWFDKVIVELGWVDTFRLMNPEPGHYTWWSNFGRAWEKNVGWRIDYQMIHKKWQSLIQSASIYKGQRFSDHAPVVVDYNLNITTAD